MNVLTTATATRNAIKAWIAADTMLEAARSVDNYLNIDARQDMYDAAAIAHNAAKRFSDSAYATVDPDYCEPCNMHPYGLVTWGCQPMIERLDSIMDKARDLARTA